MALLTAEDKKQLASAITAAEKNTSGEIVLMVEPSSGGYAWVYYAWILLGILTATLTLAIYTSRNWPLSILTFVESQALGATLGLVLASVPRFRRLLIGQKALAHKVHRASLAHFVDKGIVNTVDRTGILIYVSLFEHRVEILADKGIHTLVGQSYWDTQVRNIVGGIRRHKTRDALLQAIAEMGDKLAVHFPPTTTNPNELPDTVK